MNNILLMLRRASLLLLTLLTLSACKDKKEEEDFVIWDIVSDDLLFELQSKSGDNLLLMEEQDRAKLLESLSIRYQGKTYKFKPEYSLEGLRALPAFFAGFTYANAGQDKSLLSFGQLYGGSTAQHKVEFVWPNGQVETIVFKKVVSFPTRSSIDVKHYLYVNGEQRKFDVIKLVQPE